MRGQALTDTQLLLDLVGETYGFDDLAEYRQGILEVITRVVPCDRVGYNEITPDESFAITVPEFDQSLMPAFAALIYQNPLIQRTERTHDGRPYRISDVVDQKTFHSLELYQQFYRPLGIEWHGAIVCSTSPSARRTMAYALPDLPYAFDALEPHIDTRTMEIHHDKHHAAYVNNVNAALEGTDLADLPIEELLQSLDRVPEDKRNAVRNNGGGHYNHSLFWTSLLGSGGGGEPSGALGDAIAAAFGSFADFQAKLKAAGVGQFGSGWAWLVHDGSGLAVVGTPNQDSPLSAAKTPLLGVDVWEHAYYLLYQNRRPDYIDAWWNVVDWSTVGERFAAVS